MMIDSVLVPRDRVKILRDQAVNGRIKKELNVKMSFEDNSISIEGEGIELFQATLIVKSIGRGFSPENAFRLFNEDETFETIELNQFNENRLKIVKSRLIGTNGKTWRMMESFSGCSISVYGKTVSMIGTYEQLNIAREAIQMIIRGSTHSKVYGFLYRAKS
jgi:ribosomal RNA assembly protein